MQTTYLILKIRLKKTAVKDKFLNRNEQVCDNQGGVLKTSKAI